MISEFKGFLAKVSQVLINECCFFHAKGKLWKIFTRHLFIYRHGRHKNLINFKDFSEKTRQI